MPGCGDGKINIQAWNTFDLSTNGCYSDSVGLEFRKISSPFSFNEHLGDRFTSIIDSGFRLARRYNKVR